MGLSQGLEHVLEAAARLEQRGSFGGPVDDGPVWLVVGDGNARVALEDKARGRGLRSVRFLGPQPRERLGELLATADVGLVPMKRGVAEALVPSKLYGILAAGRPVLASVETTSEVGRVLSATGCGVIAPPEDGEALATAVRRMLADPIELARMGAAARESAEGSFSRRVCTARYATVLRDVASA